MSSNRIILLFLGVIFLIVVILSSNRIAGALRNRFGRFFPSLNILSEKVTPTPTPTVKITGVTPTIIYNKGGIQASPTPKITIGDQVKASEIPATGTETISLFLLGASFFSGVFFRKRG